MHSCKLIANTRMAMEKKINRFIIGFEAPGTNKRLAIFLYIKITDQ